MRVCFPFCLAGLLLAVVPALAGSPNLCSSTGDTRASASLPRFVAAQGSCSASCGDMGGTVMVQCTGTCTIVDQSCNAGVQGYVQCQGGARADCTSCHWCSAATSCPEGGGISCGAWGNYGVNCTGGNGACVVQCGGQIQFCPGHEGQIRCVP